MQALKRTHCAPEHRQQSEQNAIEFAGVIRLLRVFRLYSVGNVIIGPTRAARQLTKKAPKEKDLPVMLTDAIVCPDDGALIRRTLFRLALEDHRTDRG